MKAEMCGTKLSRS